MKFVLNKCYGGFRLPKGFLDIHPAADEWDIRRDDLELIAYCEEHPDELDFSCTHLRVVEISDFATDYEITEYDGAESLVYVVDGRLNWA